MSTLATGSTSGGVKKGSGVNVLPSVATAWARVRASPTSRLLIVSYIKESKTDIDVIRECPCSDGLASVKIELSGYRDRICFGGFMNDCKRFEHFYCVGSEVSGIARGRGSLHKVRGFSSV